jgi:ligand-binding SRPBCC domain-containing protein
MRVASLPSKPELSTWLGVGTFYLAPTIQVRGPFARWEHTHIFEADGPDACYLEDRIEYALPLGFLGRWLLGAFIERKLQRLFEYRHRVTREENEGTSASQ